MKSIKKIKTLLLAFVVALCASIVRAADIFTAPPLALSNTDETIATDQNIGVHEDSLSGLYVDSGISNGERYRHLLYKWGSDNQHVAVAGALDEPLGTIDNMNVATTDRVTVLLWGRHSTRKCVAAGAITVGDPIYMAASGQVSNTGSIRIGTAMNTVAAQYGIVEVLPWSGFNAKKAIFAGVRTWAGGSATTDAVTLTGLLTTDTVIATLNARASTETLVLAAPTADTLTFTLSANGTNGTTKISYAVYR
jgi:hypothetical protein